VLTWLARGQCAHVFDELVPALNRTVVLTNRHQCLATLASFSRAPALALHVRTLVLRPSSSAPPGPAHPLAPARKTRTAPDTADVCALLLRAARHLAALRTFVWDAPERPADEAIWFALRTACPRLKNVGGSAGAVPLGAYSHVGRAVASGARR
jgi:hypothetical protein